MWGVQASPPEDRVGALESTIAELTAAVDGLKQRLSESLAVEGEVRRQLDKSVLGESRAVAEARREIARCAQWQDGGGGVEVAVLCVAEFESSGSSWSSSARMPGSGSWFRRLS